MQKLQKKIYWAIILSESSHVFCCVLPTVFSLLAILTNLGMFVMPAGFVEFHHALHEWEFPMVVVSGLILALGWALHRHSLKGECHTPGCQHHPDMVHPKRGTAHWILKAATVLFVINVFIFLIFHRGMDIAPAQPQAEHAHEHAH